MFSEPFQRWADSDSAPIVPRAEAVHREATVAHRRRLNPWPLVALAFCCAAWFGLAVALGLVRLA